MSECRIPFVLRAGHESDRNFIRRGWAKTMRGSTFSRYVPHEVYWPAQHELVDRILGHAQTIVAADPEDMGHILGVLVHLPGELAICHWVYVDGAVRRLGVATMLLRSAFGDRSPIFCTQASRLFEDQALVERHGLVYSPYLLLGIMPERAAAAPEVAPAPASDERTPSDEPEDERAA